MLRTSKEKLALFIGTNYGDDACQEWMSEKQLVLLEPTYPPAPDVLARQEVRARAISARVRKMIMNLEKQLKVIETGLGCDFFERVHMYACTHWNSAYVLFFFLFQMAISVFP